MADENIKQLLQEAAFSFIGTVEQYGAATMTNLVIDNRTAVVHVDHVLDAPPAFAHYDGNRVTLQLSPASDLPPVGQPMAFFTQGVALGESVALKEIGRLPVDQVEPLASAAVQAGLTAGAFQGLRRDMHREGLRTHAGGSDAILVGRVVKCEKAGPVTALEHDPDWWKATIDVRHVEKGTVPPGPVEVLYPNSEDVRWFSIPKCKPSQEGVWIVHATAGDLKSVAPFQIVHPDDYQPVDQLDAVR